MTKKAVFILKKRGEGQGPAVVKRTERLPQVQRTLKGQSKKGTYDVYVAPEGEEIVGDLYFPKGSDVADFEIVSAKALEKDKDTPRFARYRVIAGKTPASFGSFYFEAGKVPERFKVVFC